MSFMRRYYVNIVFAACFFSPMCCEHINHNIFLFTCTSITMTLYACSRECTLLHSEYDVFPSVWSGSCFVMLITALPASDDFCVWERTEPTELHHDASSIVYSRKQKKKKKRKLLCNVLQDSHLSLWALAGRLLLGVDWPSQQQNTAALPGSVLFPNFFSGISSDQLPPPTRSILSAALNHPPSVWRPCQTFWHMKTIVLACLSRRNRLLGRLFSPTEAQQTVRQTDRLPPPRGKASVSSEIGREASEPQNDTPPSISQAEMDSESILKYYHVHGLPNKTSLASVQNEENTHLGIRTAFPDDAEKTLYILPVSGSSTFSSFFSFPPDLSRTALSCLSCDLWFICKGVCKQPLLNTIHQTVLPKWNTTASCSVH